jgi:DNA replication protein DnaC
MLNHPTLDRLNELGLFGMAKAFAEIMASGEAATLTIAEGLGLLLDRETSYRHDRRLASRLKYAKLRHQAAVEDVDYRIARGLDRVLFQKLVAGDWIDAHDNIILTGETGLGKSWLACALGHKACRDNRSVLYQRVPKLFDELALARGDGRYARLMKTLTRVEILILDDWGLQPLDGAARHDLLEIVEERHGRRSTIITSQPPGASVRVAFKLTLKFIVKTIAHGAALRHHPSSTDRWGRSPFNYPYLSCPMSTPIWMSVSRVRPRQMTIVPGGGSQARAR